MAQQFVKLKNTVCVLIVLELNSIVKLFTTNILASLFVSSLYSTCFIKQVLLNRSFLIPKVIPTYYKEKVKL